MSNLHIDLEAVNYNLSHTIGPRLELEIEKIRKETNGKAKRSSVLKGISDVITKETNMNVRMILDPYDEAAYMYPPDANINNVLTTETRKRFYTGTAIDNALKQHRKFVGHVDIENFKLNGMFKDLEIRIGLGNSYLKQNGLHTVKETVATLLHEISHGFVYFMMIARLTATNYLLTEATKRISGNYPKEQKTLILDEVAGYYNTAIPNKSMYEANEVDEKAFQTLIISMEQQCTENELSINPYSNRGYEQLADEITTRLGYGRHLATSLDKHYRATGQEGRGVVSNTVFNLLLTLQGVIFLPITMILLFSIQPEGGDYDNPKDRIRRILDQMHNGIKDPKIKKEEKLNLLEQIKTIENVESKINEDLVWFTWLSQNVFHRKSTNLAKVQQELERMLTNKLHTSAFHMETLK